ncbi:DNA alkylation repair protein [Galbitalea sp. SE-J8]|uniref:DNA alkylation repair protein n=1 Tax=Galbitalea sp. SE-J8 TaxID=3054952 RepID=UPI00259CE6A2|nr:DNA alkylation repair protein [Galbitalea sp. SE-J8]MDM4762269.1 DNA alkylation repair protein [Galbitalea sp. SE-J8]
MPSLDEVRAAVADASDDGRAISAARFFKTGPGEYGEGDVFVGVDMPAARRIARRFATLDPGDIDALLWSGVHEERMVALLVLVLQFRAASDDPARERIVEQYLTAARLERVNNWDLVDASAEFILGEWLLERPRNALFALAKSDILWERRIAIVATFAFIKAGDGSTTLELAERMLRERTDLIQKAVGWMLREVGKRVSREQLIAFLDAHAAAMGRTTLSYATEHLPPEDRARYRAQR